LNRAALGMPSWDVGDLVGRRRDLQSHEAEGDRRALPPKASRVKGRAGVRRDANVAALQGA